MCYYFHVTLKIVEYVDSLKDVKTCRVRRARSAISQSNMSKVACSSATFAFVLYLRCRELKSGGWIITFRIGKVLISETQILDNAIKWSVDGHQMCVPLWKWSPQHTWLVQICNQTISILFDLTVHIPVTRSVSDYSKSDQWHQKNL